MTESRFASDIGIHISYCSAYGCYQHTLFVLFSTFATAAQPLCLNANYKLLVHFLWKINTMNINTLHIRISRDNGSFSRCNRGYSADIFIDRWIKFLISWLISWGHYSTTFCAKKKKKKKKKNNNKNERVLRKN